jgi:outer membrane protein assembly factor BamB
MKFHLCRTIVFIVLLGCFSSTVAVYAGQGANFYAGKQHLYIYRGGRLYSKDLTTGKALWDIPIPGDSLDVLPVEDGDHLAFCAGGASQRIIGVRVDTGRMIWNKTGECKAITVALGKLIVLSRLDGSISAIDPRSGKVIWKNDGNGLSGSLYAVGEKVISDTLSLDARSGKTIKKFTLGRRLLGVGETALFWTQGPSELLSSDLDGNLRWRSVLPLQRPIQIRIDADAEYVAVYDDYPYSAKSGLLVKLDPEGKELWKTGLRAASELPPIPIGDVAVGLYLALPTTAEHLSVEKISSVNGDVEWSSPRLDGAVGPVVEAGGMLLLSRRDGRVIALPLNGTVIKMSY